VRHVITAQRHHAADVMRCQRAVMSLPVTTHALPPRLLLSACLPVTAFAAHTTSLSFFLSPTNYFSFLPFYATPLFAGVLAAAFAVMIRRLLRQRCHVYRAACHAA